MQVGDRQDKNFFYLQMLLLGAGWHWALWGPVSSASRREFKAHGNIPTKLCTRLEALIAEESEALKMKELLMVTSTLPQQSATWYIHSRSVIQVS